MVDAKEEYQCRLNLLSTRGITPVLMKVFLGIVDDTCNGDVDRFLNGNKKRIIKLKTRKILNEETFKILFPQSGKTDVRKWDISLLTCILCNFCTLEGRCDKKILTKILKQEQTVNNNNNIQLFLAASKSLIDQNGKRYLNVEQYEQIFPKSGVTIDIREWDFEVLLIVLATCTTGVRIQALTDQLKPFIITEVDLSQFNIDLTAFLKKHCDRFKTLLKDGLISKEQYELLFPKEQIYSDLNTWDKWLLVAVIINVCPHLKQTSIKAIVSLRRVRNEKVAHVSSSDIDESEFKSLWASISEAIETLIENEVNGYTVNQWKESVQHIISDPLKNDIYQECKRIEQKIDKQASRADKEIHRLTMQQRKVSIDQDKRLKKVEQAIQELAVNPAQPYKDFGKNMQVISATSLDVFESRVEIQCIDIKIVLKGNNVATVRRAEDLIRQAIRNEEDVSKKAGAALLTLSMIKDITTIKKEITKDGCVIVGVLEESLILKVQCHTLMELTHLMRYGIEMQIHLDELAVDVGQLVGDRVEIHASFPENTLTAINDAISSVCIKNGIRNPFVSGDEHETYYKTHSVIGNTLDETDLGTTTLIRAEKIATLNVAFKEEKSTSWYVRSCVVLPTGQIVLCDQFNINIKLFDETFTRRDLLKLEMPPHDSSLSLKNTTHVFVTIPTKKSIYTIKVNKGLRKGKKLRVDGTCLAITCCKIGIAVNVSRNDVFEMQIINYDGKILRKISQDTTPRLKMLEPEFMTCINESSQIIISDCQEQCLTSLNVETGVVESVYKDPGLGWPRSVTADSEGNIYVASLRSHSVHVLSRNMQKMGELLIRSDGLLGPGSLCYNKLNNTLILKPYRFKSEMRVYKLVSGQAKRL